MEEEPCHHEEEEDGGGEASVHPGAGAGRRVLGAAEVTLRHLDQLHVLQRQRLAAGTKNLKQVSSLGSSYI